MPSVCQRAQLVESEKPLPPLNNTALIWIVFICFCVFACLWLLAYYPIMTNYDLSTHLEQVSSGQYETHHALAYSLLIWELLHLAGILGLTSTWAFLMLGLLQMTVMGLSIGYGLLVMNKAGTDRRAVIAAAVYYCVFPLFGYFAFSTTKDTLFSCFLLLTAIELYRLSNRYHHSSIDCKNRINRPRRYGEFWNIARMVLFAVLMCQFRYNGTASLILFTAGILLYGIFRLVRRKPLSPTIKRLAVILPLVLLLNAGMSAALVKVTGATTPETVKRDMFSLPLQQLARVLQTTEDEADIARIEALFGVDDIRERYYPRLSDPVKAAFLYPDDNYRSALRVWLKFSVKYPVIYLEAFLENTRGAWYIDDLSHTKMAFWTNAYGYLEIAQEYTGDNAAYPIRYQSILPFLQTFFQSLFNDNEYLNVPLLRYFFALAVQSWIVVIGLIFAMYHRRRKARNIFLFALCALLPVLLLPCMISRYFLPLFLLNPLCLLALTARKETSA